MSGSHRTAFVLLFFCSGALGLVYEVLWQRSLSLTFGVGGFAISIILAAYMSGLALGTWAGGSFGHRVRSPVLAYALLEAGVGLYALILPTLMGLATHVYRWVYQSFAPGPVAFGLVQGGILLLLLLVPTTLMGATFPLLVRAVVPADARAGAHIGWLYVANVGGAVLGTLAGGFFLLPELGHATATGVAVAGSFTIAVLALVFSRSAQASDWRAEIDDEPAPLPPLAIAAPPRAALWVGAGSAGAAAMIYEVAWTRLLALQMGSSVYAFTTMLATFLLGLALGGVAAAAVLRRRPELAAVGFGVAQALALLGVAGSQLMFPYLPATYVQLYHLFGAGGTAFGAQVCMAALVMLPPTLAMGAALPMAMAAAAGGKGDVTPSVAGVYVANTVGSVVGTLLAGFGLLPWLGVSGTVSLGMAVAAVGLLAVTLPPARPARRLAWVAAVALGGVGLWQLSPAWDPLLMAAGLFKHVKELQDADREEITEYAHNNLELLYYGEGLNSAVTVGRSRSSGALWLANNGKVDASSIGDLPTQLMLAHMPMATHPDPQSVAVIGLASGITLGGILQHPVAHVDVLELESHIVSATHFFDEHNNRPLEDPRVSLHIADARNHLLLTDTQWDVIVSEPSNPWITGVSNLFTQEFFEIAKDRLRPGGLLCQWVQLYELSPRDLRALLRTFHLVFPEVVLYWSVGDGDLILVGSGAPLTLAPARVEALLKRPEVAASLARIEVDNVFDWLSWYHMGSAEVEQMTAGEQGLNTDDNARIEFRAPLYLGLDTSSTNARQLLEHRAGPEQLLIEDIEDPALHEALALAYLKRNLFGLATAAMGRYREAGGDPDFSRSILDRIEEEYKAYPYLDPTMED